MMGVLDQIKNKWVGEQSAQAGYSWRRTGGCGGN